MERKNRQDNGSGFEDGGKVLDKITQKQQTTRSNNDPQFVSAS